MVEIVLGDNQIESLINGESIHITSSDGKTVLIRQSYMKDAAAPIINHDKKIYSDAEIENIKRVTGAMSNAMRLGV